MTSITRRCRSVSPELSARMPGGRPGRDLFGPSGCGTSAMACTGSSRPWERSWAVMAALSAVVVTSSAPLDGLPCSTTVVAFERLRQTHVRVKNRGSPVGIGFSGVWPTRCSRPGRAPRCCTLHRRDDGPPAGVPPRRCPVCHQGSRGPGTGPPSPCGVHRIRAPPVGPYAWDAAERARGYAFPGTRTRRVPASGRCPRPPDGRGAHRWSCARRVRARRSEASVPLGARGPRAHCPRARGRTPPTSCARGCAPRACRRRMCEPTATSSGWMATAAHKLCSPGLPPARRSPMLGVASRGR